MVNDNFFEDNEDLKKVPHTFGAKLRYLRNERNLTQIELANKLGTTQKQISKWETNRIEPNLFAIYQVCAFFNVTADFMLNITDIDGNNTFDFEITSFNYNLNKEDIEKLEREQEQQEKHIEECIKNQYKNRK